MNLLKLTGVLIVVVTCGLMGIAAGERQKEYINVLISLKRCLVLIKGEIAYAYTPLKEIFTRLSLMKDEIWSSFFVQILDELDSGERGKMRGSLSEIWKRVCKSAKVCGYMKSEELEELIRFGNILGGTDRESQINSINLLVENITDRAEHLRENIYNKVKLCHVLGIAAGLFIIILLV